MDGFIDEMM